MSDYKVEFVDGKFEFDFDKAAKISFSADYNDYLNKYLEIEKEEQKLRLYRYELKQKIKDDFKKLKIECVHCHEFIKITELPKIQKEYLYDDVNNFYLTQIIYVCPKCSMPFEIDSSSVYHEFYSLFDNCSTIYKVNFADEYAARIEKAGKEFLKPFLNQQIEQEKKAKIEAAKKLLIDENIVSPKVFK